ncbi:hypothetical protein SNE40_013654 [Patella caerulea]|uniref:C-type lectin domain-containing protein n=1 Tax=Patella caerulea TaxID=87958 RepID=A0AAN8JGF5_PATCE
MDYTFSIKGVTDIVCGARCTSTPYCKSFHYDLNTCYILNYPGIGSVNITSFYGSENWTDSCSVDGYPLYGGRFCMKMFKTNKIWSKANKTCNQDGAKLLIMKSEDFFLKKEVIDQHGGGHHYWIGGNDLEKEGDWIWNDGSPLQSNQWEAGNPSNLYDAEHCLEFGPLRFNDQQCFKPVFFICEKLKY